MTPDPSGEWTMLVSGCNFELVPISVLVVYDGTELRPTRFLSVDTGLDTHDAADTIMDQEGQDELIWHQADAAASFTVYIDHHRVEANDQSIGNADDYFGVLAVELTAQTANHGFSFEPWSSPLILAEAGKVRMCAVFWRAVSYNSHLYVVANCCECARCKLCSPQLRRAQLTLSVGCTGDCCKRERNK